MKTSEAKVPESAIDIFTDKKLYLAKPHLPD